MSGGNVSVVAQKASEAAWSSFNLVKGFGTSLFGKVTEALQIPQQSLVHENQDQIEIETEERKEPMYYKAEVLGEGAQSTTEESQQKSPAKDKIKVAL